MNPQDQFPPVFATNRPDEGVTVAAEVVRLLAGLRQGFVVPPDLAIASAYLNPGGFGLLADELERVPRVRLLLGAEPDQGASRPSTAKASAERLAGVLSAHDEWLAAERDLTGFTREEDATAQRLVAWLESIDAEGVSRVEVRRYTNGFLHGKAFIAHHPQLPAVLAGSSNFTYAGLARNAELNLGYPSGQHTYLVLDWFERLWAESDPYPLAEVYAARWLAHQPWLIFMRMLWEMYGAHLDEDDDTKVRTLLELTGFQRDGVARMLRLLERHGGVLVADEVGLGKTFMAGEVINRATTENRQMVLVVAPAALKSGMWDPFIDRHDFSRRVKVHSYDDIRLMWQRDSVEARRYLDDFALVVVDEAHNLRNPNAQRTEAVAALVGGENPKQVVLLTATPVNNTLMDLHALLSLYLRNDAVFAEIGIPSIRRYIQHAESLDPDSLSPEHLFDLMDQVAVRRTRRFVRNNYVGETIRLADGTLTTIKFPTPVLHRLDYPLDDLGELLLERVVYALDSEGDEDPAASRYEKRRRDPERLMLARYTSSAYSLSGDPVEAYQVSNAGLLRSSLLKRLESSPVALANTLEVLIASHHAFLSGLEHGWVLVGEALREWTGSNSDDFDQFLSELDDEKATRVSPASDFHTQALRDDVAADLVILEELRELAFLVIDSGSDLKLVALIDRLREIASEASNISKEGLSAGDRRKTIVFSTFADTIDHIHRQVVEAIEAAGPDDPLSVFAGRVAPAVFGRKTGVDQEARARILGGFAPETAGLPGSVDRYDLLLTTDVLSEGVNLQQAGRMINFDLPWNPMRIVQRHGRIDRIGSKHSRVFLDCFFPAQHLETLLRLEERLQVKLAKADAAIGAGAVLPGFESRGTQVFADTREQIDQLLAEDPTLLEQGTHAALSGEEYRKRLRDAGKDIDGFDEIRRLPFGSGSGFLGAGPRTGYVFCAKIGEHEKPWFRFVPTDDEWNPLLTDTGEAVVIVDTLTALTTADPGDAATPRDLSDLAYDRAFDAWEVARHHIFETWQRLTDAKQFLPEVPKALQEAAHLVYEHGQHLGPDAQQELLARLNTNPPERAVREIRAVINAEKPAPDRVADLDELVRTLGIQTPPPATPLPAIVEDQVRLVVWMAVSRAVGDDREESAVVTGG